MSEHTKEPWMCWETTGLNGTGWLSISTQGEKTMRPVVCHIVPIKGVTENDEANARRIVACVNACAGMDDPAKEIATLQAQRDELLAALKEMRFAYINKDDDCPHDFERAALELAEAIEKYGKANE